MEVLGEDVVVGPKFGTPEAIEIRRLKVGASEVAAVFGRSRWETAYGLAAKKLGLIPAPSGGMAEHQQLGHDFEEAVIRVASRRLGVSFEPNDRMMYRPLFPWLVATPDATHRDAVSGEVFVMNAKTSAWRYRDHFGEEGTDELPEEYLLQAQAEMAVVGASLAYYPVMFDARTVRTYRVDRDEQMIGLIMERTEQFADMLREGRLPTLDVNHSSAVGAVKGVFGRIGEPPSVDLTEGDELAWVEVGKCRQKIKDLEAKKDAMTACLLVAMENATIGRLPSGAVIRRVVIEASHVTQADVDALQERVGQVKRSGSIRLMAAGKTAKKGET